VMVGVVMPVGVVVVRGRGRRRVVKLPVAGRHGVLPTAH
jgi:hypothetical protein